MATRERWRLIPGWELFEVSSIGRIRTSTRRVTSRYRFYTVQLTTPKVIKPHRVTRGTQFYRMVNLRGADGSKRLRYVHQLVLEAFRGPRPSRRHEAAHRDGDGEHNHLSNLRWATFRSQWLDKLRHGRANIGERCGSAKLTREQVRQIRELCARGQFQNAVAPQFGVSRSAVHSIVRRKRWAWLD